MPQRDPESRVPAAARAFAALQAQDATTAGEGPSAGRRLGAAALALLFLATFPLYLTASSGGLLGDTPTALAKGPNSGPSLGGEDDDDDRGGPGPAPRAGDENDDTGTHTRDRARAATDDTSRNGASTRGTTRDHDTRTDSNTHTRARGQTQTRTSTGR